MSLQDLKRHQIRSAGVQRKIVFYSVLYTLGALLFVSFLGFLPLYSRLKNAEENNLLHAAHTRALTIQEYVNRIQEVTCQIASRTAARTLIQDWRQGVVSREEMEQGTRESLQDALHASKEAVGVTRIGTGGEFIGRAGIPIPEYLWNLSDEGTQVSVSDPQVIGNNLYLIAAAPVRSLSGEKLGTDLVLFDTGELQRIVWHQTNLRRSGDSLLGRFFPDHSIIFFPGRQGEKELYNIRTQESVQQKALEEATQGRGGLLSFKTTDSDNSGILAFAPVGGTDWGLLVTMDERELYSRIHQLAVSVAGTVLVLTACGGIGIYLLLKPLTVQALEHSQQMEKLNGDLEQEISERRRMEINLRRSEKEWTQTFEAITDAVAIIDAGGHVLKMNRACEAFLRSLAPIPEGKERCQIHSGLKHSSDSCPFTRMLTSRSPEYDEFHDPHADRYFYISVYPLADGAGELWGGVQIAEDITEEKKAERMKDEMLSAVSHEMRTPLTAMLGFIEFLLENEVDPEKQRDFLRTVHQETEKLNELISNFLDLQRLQAQLATYNFYPLSVSDLLRETAHLFTVASRKHRIQVDPLPDLPPALGDVKRLQQVLKNLLSNAIKYSPEGGTVTVGAYREGKQVVIWVKDQGMGIPPQAQGKIFNRFYRVDDSDRRIPGGFGLGLALVREVLKAHKGRIWVESSLGQGSTFYFSLPIGSQAEGEQGGDAVESGPFNEGKLTAKG